MQVRMEINTNHQCETCVEFWSADNGTPGMRDGYHQAHLNISPEVWEAMGSPMAFDLQAANVESIDA